MGKKTNKLVNWIQSKDVDSASSLLDCLFLLKMKMVKYGLKNISSSKDKDMFWNSSMKRIEIFV